KRHDLVRLVEIRGRGGKVLRCIRFRTSTEVALRGRLWIVSAHRCRECDQGGEGDELVHFDPPVAWQVRSLELHCASTEMVSEPASPRIAMTSSTPSPVTSPTWIARIGPSALAMLCAW